MRLASHDSCALIGNDGFRKFIGCSNGGSLFAGQTILRACHAEGAVIYLDRENPLFVVTERFARVGIADHPNM